MEVYPEDLPACLSFLNMQLDIEKTEAESLYWGQKEVCLLGEPQHRKNTFSG